MSDETKAGEFKDATPRPWESEIEVGRSFALVRGPVDKRLIFAMEFLGFLVTAHRRLHEEDLANLALIVRAVNAYEPMLAYILAEEEIDKFDCPHVAEDQCRCGEVHTAAMKRARELRDAALRAANGGG